MPRLLVCGWMICACAGPSSEVKRENVASFSSSNGGAMLMDERLAPKLSLTAQQGYRDPGTGVFIAETLLQNMSLEMVTLECRTLFKNDQGVTTEVSVWKEVILTPGGKAVVMAPSIRPETTRFITQIRPR